MMGCTASWSVMAALTRELSNDIHVFEIVFFRSLFGGLFLLPWLFRTGLKGLHTKRPAMHATRGIIGLITIYMMFTAITITLLGEVAAILATRPIFASLAAVIILREAALGRRWTATILGVAGALIILRPGMVEMSTGVLLVLASVIMLSALTIIMKVLVRTDSPDSIATYQMIIYVPISLIPALFVWDWPTLTQLVMMVGTGMFGTFTQRSLTRAYAAADATVVVPFDSTRLVFAAFLGLLLFQEFPDIWVWTGGAVIFAATVALTHMEAKAFRQSDAKG
jgi:drug/metabolite transporter (DMT)-like permease